MKDKLVSILLRMLYFLNIKQNPSKDRIVNISGKKISIGKYTYGYESTRIFSWGENIDIKIGRFCSVAAGLNLFCGGNHNVKHMSTFPFGELFNAFFDISQKKPVVFSNGNIIIGNDVWIGRDVTIMSGLTIGDGSVIAANSHVVKNIEPYSIYGGNPAKFIRYRFSKEIIELLLKIQWWNLDDHVIEKIYPILLDTPDMYIYEKITKIIENNN